MNLVAGPEPTRPASRRLVFWTTLGVSAVAVAALTPLYAHHHVADARIAFLEAGDDSSLARIARSESRIADTDEQLAVSREAIERIEQQLAAGPSPSSFMERLAAAWSRAAAGLHASSQRADEAEGSGCSVPDPGNTELRETTACAAPQYLQR